MRAIPGLRSMRSTPPFAGIPQALARERAARIADLHYRLECRIAARARRLEGVQEIRFCLTERPDEALVLDWRPQLARADVARALRSLRVNGRAGARNSLRRGHLHIDADALQHGANCIALAWSAPILESGTALIRHRDADDGALYVYSLFVPADASTVFPCFDQPDLKARFSLTLTMPANWTAIGNAPVARSRRSGRSRSIAFATTEPISTYAFAFAAGPFIALGAGRQEEPSRVWVRRSQRRRARPRIDEILRLNSEAVRFCTRYFGHRFPFAKYDLVLIPHFPYRGMEHAGATFLDEDAALLSSSHGSAERFQCALLVFHETAHQWMGDLVTMRWFDDLWIKEGFANFIAFKLAARVCSRRYARLAFHDLKVSAWEADRTRGATALHHPLADVMEAKSAYNTIVYAKAPAILKMLEHRLRAQTFRRAVRAVVRSHAYGAIDWRDLVAAFERASGRALNGWAARWLLKPGAPKVRAPDAHRDDHSYALVTPDRSGVASALRALPRTRDELRRMQLWEYLWCAVRNGRLPPVRFVELALSRAGAERCDLTLSRLADRLRIVIDRLLGAAQQQHSVPQLESLAWDALRSSRRHDVRRVWLCALVGWTRTEDGFARLHALLAADHDDLRFADRFAVAGALVASGRMNVRRATSALGLDDRSFERRPIVHCLQAAEPRPERKREILGRWLADAPPPDHWIDAALPYFNHPGHAQLTLPLLKRALEALPMLAARHKIFFVNRWLAAFIGGQRGDDALAVIRSVLDRRALATDLRLKVLEAAHGLEQDVAARKRWHF